MENCIINLDILKQWFKNINEEYKDILGRILRKELIENIKILEEIVKTQILVPPLPNIFDSFKNLDEIFLVIVFEHPINANTTLNIYNCLQKCKLIHAIPSHNNLQKLTASGVLLLNSNLTTSTSGDSHDFWKKYTDGIIKELDKSPRIFILLGDNAIKKQKYITNGTVFTWGSPSPLNAVNTIEHKLNFVNCDCFIKANSIHSINWNVLLDTQFDKQLILPANLTNDTIYIFTDGAAKNNRTPEICNASWAYYIYPLQLYDSGIVAKTKISCPSNQRGELFGIYHGCTKLLTVNTNYKKIILISDSEYSLNIINSWWDKWVSKNELRDKKNLDIIEPMMSGIKQLQKQYTFTTKHVNSHIKEPMRNTYQWFLWYGNELVDKLASLKIG